METAAWDWKYGRSDVLQQVDLWARTAPKSVPSVKSCLSVNFPVCSVCQKLGVYQQLPTKAPQYDFSTEGEGRPDEIPVVVAPSAHSDDEEWWADEVDLNTVTISNMSIDSKPVDEVGTEKSQLTPLQENQL